MLYGFTVWLRASRAEAPDEEVEALEAVANR